MLRQTEDIYLLYKAPESGAILGIAADHSEVQGSSVLLHFLLGISVKTLFEGQRGWHAAEG
jgi:hypothetical protein